MNPIKTLWQGGNADNAARRGRVAYPLTIAGSIALLPLLVNELSKPDPGVGIQVLFLVLILAVNGFALFKKKRALLPHALTVIPISAGMVMSVQQGSDHAFYAALFCYPAVIYFYAVLSRQIAHACTAVMSVTVTAAIYLRIDVDIATIFGATLLLTIIVINLVFNALSDMTEEVPGEKDPFANILSQQKMDRHIQQAIKNSKKRDTRLSGLRIELDHYATLKRLNGQEAAENVVKGAAMVMRKRLRNADLLFRYEESGFFALLPNTPEEGAIIAAEQLRTLVLKAELADNEMGCISIGIGEYVPDESPQSWMAEMNALLKTATNNGGNQFARRHPNRQPPVVSSTESMPASTSDSPRSNTNSI